MIKIGLRISLVIVLFLSLNVQSQSIPYSPKGTFNITLGVPAKPNNFAFERTMEGLLNAGIDFRYNVYKGLTFGIGAKYALFTLNAFAFNNLPISGSYQMPGGYLMAGYEKFTTDRISFTGSIRAGYSLMMSFNDSCEIKLGGPNIAESFFIEPQVEMTMLADLGSPHGFSMLVGYNLYFHEYGREDLCMNNVSGILDEHYQGITRFFSIGFGYRYFLGQN
jgi:hypothetical protein